jgi:hypothetical protein
VVDLRPVRLDRPGRLQLADAFVHGRGGEPDLAGEFRVRGTGVLAQEVDQPAVDGVHGMRP